MVFLKLFVMKKYKMHIAYVFGVVLYFPYTGCKDKFFSIFIMHKILVTEPEYFTKESLRLLSKVGRVEARRMSRRELLSAVHDAEVLVVRIDTKVDALLLRRAKKLRCVVSATTGLNHIDTAYLQKHRIPLFSLSGAHSISTAEHAIALLFTAARRIPWAHTHMARGLWERWEFIGTELTGKTLGIIGIGRIGTEVARRACALGMCVIAYDPYLSRKEIRVRGGEKVSWRNILQKSDILSLHAPLTRKTFGMMGKKDFSLVRPSLILINTARGAIIQETALISALAKRQIYMAALDVYPEEPLAPSHALRKYAKTHNNLILTPHIAASTHEAISRASLFAANAVLHFFA